MEYETISKETPEMKQLVSGIKNLTKRVRATAQTHRPLFGENSISQGEKYARGSSSLPALCRTIGTKAFSHTRRLQGRYFTDCLTCNEF